MLTNRKQLYIYLLFLYFSNLVAAGSTYVFFMLPQGLGMLGATGAFIGLTIGAPRIVLIILSLLFKKHSDRVDENKISLLASTLGAMIFSTIALSHNLNLILVLAFLYGFTYTVGMNYITSMALKYIPKKEKMSIMGFFSTSGSLGVSLGPVIAAWVGMRGEGLGYPNFLAFAGTLLSTVWLLLTIASMIYRKKLKKNSTIKTETLPHMPPKGIEIYKPLIPITVIFGILFLTSMTFIVSYSRSLGLASAQSFFVAFGVTTLVERLLLFKKMGQWKKQHILYGGFLFYFLGFTVITLLFTFPSPMILMLAGVMVGIGHGVLFPTFNVIFTDLSPRYVANATFVFTLFYLLPSFFSAPIGYIADALGYPAMHAIILISLSTLTIYFFARKDARELMLSLEHDYSETGSSL